MKTKQQVAENHGIINGMSIYSNTETIEKELYEAMEEYAQQQVKKNDCIADVVCMFKIDDKVAHKDNKSKIMTVSRIEILHTKEVRLWVGYTYWIDAKDAINCT